MMHEDTRERDIMMQGILSVDLYNLQCGDKPKQAYALEYGECV